ncbi:hypothetical protein IC235_14785 [Hymenobacter sp. BT664]|uniref:Uncharacterized protein n=1 Tax=Hymenobacter montanus TaxID=2771359 RepID=A0A927BF77_9BACT|nr:hypothetical protein [Hymenobacter montanus]MBD2769155.1 hypothetical protein [Hymenobacter montanus]
MILTDKAGNDLRRRLLTEWGGFIDTLYDAEQLPKLQEEEAIPSSWLRITGSSCTAVVAELWGEAREALPRFVEYLSQSTLNMIVTNGRLGPMLVYYIQDWNKGDFDDYPPDIAQYFEDGFMLAGLPTPIEQIEAFEQSTGKIPASLKRLWQVHGFMLLKNGAFLSSLDRTLKEFCDSPRVLGLRKVSYDPKEQYECLAIANVWKELPFCFIRKPGTCCWEDVVVEAYRDRDKVDPPGNTHLDDLLTDWTFSEWSPLS